MKLVVLCIVIGFAQSIYCYGVFAYLPKEMQDKVLECRNQYKVNDALLRKEEPFPKEKLCYFNCSSIIVGYFDSTGKPTPEVGIKNMENWKMPERNIDITKECFKVIKGVEPCELADTWRLCALNKAKQS